MIKILVATAILGVVALYYVDSDITLNSMLDDMNNLNNKAISNNIDKKCIEIVNIMIADNVLQKYERDCIPLENINTQ